MNEYNGEQLRRTDIVYNFQVVDTSKTTSLYLMILQITCHIVEELETVRLEASIRFNRLMALDAWYK